MRSAVFGVLLVAHGLLTILVWAPRPSPAAPMSTSRSWLLGEARTASVVLAITAGVLIAVAGAGLLSNQDWWSLVGLVGGTLSLALFGLFFTPWWLIGITISATMVVVALRERMAT